MRLHVLAVSVLLVAGCVVVDRDYGLAQEAPPNAPYVIATRLAPPLGGGRYLLRATLTGAACEHPVAAASAEFAAYAYHSVIVRQNPGPPQVVGLGSHELLNGAPANYTGTWRNETAYTSGFFRLSQDRASFEIHRPGETVTLPAAGRWNLDWHPRPPPTSPILPGGSFQLKIRVDYLGPPET